MLENTHSEKEILVFDAVNSLMSEGVKLHTVKVADIAKKAGIGKGTIYDYFKSKDEILEKALIYNTGIEFEESIKQINEVNGFKNKCYTAFDVSLKASIDNSSAAIILFSNLRHSEFKEILSNNKDIMNERYKLISKNIEEIILSGVSEGIIKEQEDKEYQLMVFFSSVIGFINSICMNKDLEKESTEKAKDRAYKLILKGLS